MNTIRYIIYTGFLITILASCNTTKYVKENQYLLKNNRIEINGKKTRDTEITDYLIQRPNTKVLGFPLSLHFYNLGNTKYDSIHKAWKSKQEKKYTFLDKVISKKQTYKLGENYKNINKWFLNKGEAPVIIDSLKTLETSRKLKQHFFNQGYFNATVSQESILDLKRATNQYTINTNKAFHLGKISYNIESEQIDTILKKHIDQSFLKEGEQFNYQNFKNEVKRITNILRNKGFYTFSEDLISFHNIDTLHPQKTTPVEIRVVERTIEKDDKTHNIPTRQFVIKKVKVLTDNNFEDLKNQNPYREVSSYDHIDFVSYKKQKYRLKSLAKSIFLKPGNLYKDSTDFLTRKHLKSLKNFKLVRINYKKENDSLIASIFLTPLKKYAISLNAEVIHSNIKNLGIAGGFSFIDRNLLRGAEIFKLSFQGSIFDAATEVNDIDNNNFDAWEIGVDASLEFPRFIAPFRLNKLVPSRMTPKTRLTIGTSFQNNIGLDKQKVNGVIDYNWRPTNKQKHTIELINVQFVNNLNTNSYFSIYRSEFNELVRIKNIFNPEVTLNSLNAVEYINSVPTSFAITNPIEYRSLLNIQKRREIIVANNVIPSFSYAFEYNNRNGLSDHNYEYFRAKLSSSGNLSKFILDDSQSLLNTFLDIPISQFTKFDLEFKKFWQLYSNNVLAFRTFIGAAIPTGDSEDIPFVSSYFAGGSNDIRAWQTYDLGPGSSNTGLEFNIGNLKLLSSLEYRFKIINSIHGAFFVDAGNIWNTASTSTATSEETFNNLSSLKDIAVGSGFGIRYDFNFLVLRLDLGIKTYEPYLETNKWFRNYSLTKSILNIGINYPF